MSTDHIQPDLEEVRRRYAAERARRLRAEGAAQYQELTGRFADFDKDTFAEPMDRPAVSEEVDVAILGGGFAGMITAINLDKQGISNFRIIEKAGDFGGTWYWNRYPGCMCDVESYTYLPLLEETGYMPTEKYASAPEIFDYCRLLGNRYGLYDRALFQTVINGATWDDAERRWVVSTDRGDVIRARYLITAGGILHKAKLPGIPGIETYQGHAFHAARWDYDYTGGSPTKLPVLDKLADKRVGIIGTGATAVQAVPQLAKYAKEVFVFQRTPSAVGERGNHPTDIEWFNNLQPGWHEERVVNFTNAVTGAQPDQDLVQDGWTEVMWENTLRLAASEEEKVELERSDFETMEKLRRRVSDIVEDPETAEKLKPWYSKNCKRVCFHDEYLQAFNLPNVHLVDTSGQGVNLVNERGPVVDGVEYPVDCLIFASGFETATELHQRLGFDPIGRDGVPLSEAWSHGVRTLHGILSGGFPNMMIISTLQAGFGTNFVHFLAHSAAHVAALIAECVKRGIVAIEASPEGEDSWLVELYNTLGNVPEYYASCTPGYYNGEQQQVTERSSRTLVYMGSLLDYGRLIDQWFAEGNLAGTITTRD